MKTAPSYAKLNLFLHVLGKRADGFHNIYTLFCGIDLHDTITITPSDRMHLVSTGISMPVDTSNIIYKVDEILRSEHGLTKSYTVTVHKRVPIGAGLGGGSSNAAAYLRLVNEEARLGLSAEATHAILSRVGSDAPFFMLMPEYTAALGEGRGEVLTPVEVGAKLYFILINPGIFVSTASVYNDEKLQLTNTDDLPKILNLSNISYVRALMANDMQDAVFERHPLLQDICNELDKSGAVKSMMSGSGSTVFGLFSDESARDSAYTVLKDTFNGYMVLKADSL